jgi:L,D-peptidoglycan transpeptidase YkuD (ErfK/YbiS/YcfS/YnhG family)
VAPLVTGLGLLALDAFVALPAVLVVAVVIALAAGGGVPAPAAQAVFVLIAAVALAAACPANTANDLRSPPPPRSRQLITVEAATTRTTYATARIWRRSEGCWAAAGGPVPARVGWNGLSANRHEGDGTTPIGTFAIGPTM